MAGLLFKPQDLLNELKAFQLLAAPLLDPSTTFVLDQMGTDITSTLCAGGTAILQIPLSTPLRTRVSVGEYEPPAKNCNRRVLASFTGKWEIARHDSGKRGKVRRIEFTGIASTVVELSEISDDKPPKLIAKWKVELGDQASPGCYFHTHAGNSDFTLPVPRQPSLCATPMSAMAHVLGELFQGPWSQAVTGTSHHQNSWRTIQYRRLSALLKWKLQQIETNDTSPWLALKLAKPQAELFL